jgi:hypothetical protein
MTDIDIGKTILQQLGGHRFIAMTGARNFLAFGNGLGFRIPTRSGPNAIKIILTPMDVYTMLFTRIRGTSITKIANIGDVYAEDLRRTFAEHTGLGTHL